MFSLLLQRNKMEKMKWNVHVSFKNAQITAVYPTRGRFAGTHVIPAFSTGKRRLPNVAAGRTVSRVFRSGVWSKVCTSLYRTVMNKWWFLHEMAHFCPENVKMSYKVSKVLYFQFAVLQIRFRLGIRSPTPIRELRAPLPPQYSVTENERKRNENKGARWKMG